MNLRPTTTGAWVRLVLAVAAVILLVVFVALNAQQVEIDFLVTTAETRLVWALLLAALFGVLIGLALPYFWKQGPPH